MIQTTLFNYINCKNKSTKQAVYKLKQLKQTSLQDYFSIKPKKKSILDYFKRDEIQEQKKEVFELVLVDVEKTAINCCEDKNEIECTKKNIYDQDLKYIAISYRWGEVSEQLVKTSDYTAHITSFELVDLVMLCTYIWNESDLKEIQYLWIDAISVDQQNHERKKETILKMSEIYKKAAYILAVPDLHFRYLWNNPANKEILELIEKYNEVIYEEIRNKDENEKIIIEEKSKSEKKTYQLLKYFTLDHLSANGKKNEELKRAYGFLAFLVFDWWNRAWVVSEYQIAKEKYKKQGTPLKYIFISLLYPGIHTFFSYSFDDSQYKNINSGSYTNITYYSVDSSSNFMPFLISRFIQRDHLNLLLESNATKNEDRFHAILPSWTKYSHLIEDKSTISNWNITDITSVRLKLYEIMDDLWDKAKLLHACSVIINLPILPSYASQFDTTCLYLYEKEDIDQAYDAYSSELSKLAIKTFGNDNFVRQYLLDNKKGYGLSLYTENLTYIQLKVRHLCLCIKANKYFTNTAKPIIDQDFLSAYSLKNDDGLRYAFIPFFTFTMTGLIDSLPMCSSNVFLLGNIDQNRWILYSKRILNEEGIAFSCFTDNYIFNIY